MSLSHCAVFRWCIAFRIERVIMNDMPKPGQAHFEISIDSVALVDNLMQENYRITREISETLFVGKETANTIHNQRLEYIKVYVQQVPRATTKS